MIRAINKEDVLDAIRFLNVPTRIVSASGRSYRVKAVAEVNGETIVSRGTVFSAGKREDAEKTDAISRTLMNSKYRSWTTALHGIVFNEKTTKFNEMMKEKNYEK